MPGQFRWTFIVLNLDLEKYILKYILMTEKKKNIYFVA